MVRGSLGGIAGLGLFISAIMPGEVLAHRYDISLRGLGCYQRTFSGQCLAESNPEAVRRYRLLAGELIASLSPRAMQPAETLGMSGFEFSMVSTIADISENAAYWHGQPGNPVLEGALTDGVPSAFWIPSLHVRKGLPMSMELGVTATYLAFSEMFMLGGEWKLALHESFFRWVPALALRAGASRLVGAADLDISTVEAGVLASLPFGVGGMVQITPFVGYTHLVAQVNSQIIDETPHVVGPLRDNPTSDQGGGTRGSLYSFPTVTWTENQFPRFYGGMRFNVAMIEFMYEVDVTVLPLVNKKLTSHSIKLGFDV